MSDQGERGARWTATHEETAEPTPEEAPTGPMSQINGAAEGSAGAARTAGPQAPGAEPPPFQVVFPEVEIPAPEGRTEFSTPDPGGPPAPATPDLEVSEIRQSWSESWAEPAPVDDWRPARGGETAPPPASSWFEPTRRDAADETPAEPEDVRVAPVPSETPDGPEPVDAHLAGDPGEPGETVWPPETPAPGQAAGQQDDEPGFDGIADGPGDPNYAPVMPSGPSTPPKPGKPSSGNWRMPEWINEEEAAAKAAKAPKEPGRDEGHPGRPAGPSGAPGRAFPEDERRSRLGLFAGVGLLVVALIAAAGVYLLKGRGSGDEAPAAQQSRPAAGEGQAPKVQLPPAAQLPNFSGTPTRVLGRVDDAHSGLNFPRLAAPWQIPTKKNKLGVTGWSGQQILVTERRANRIWYGQLLTGTLHPSLAEAYRGPDSVQTVAVLAKQAFQKQYYAFQHTERPLASQALTVGGRPGWLVATNLRYKRPGIKATGELMVVAIIDTGRDTPAVAFASMPNTHRKLWPDVKRFITQLKPMA